VQQVGGCSTCERGRCSPTIAADALGRGALQAARRCGVAGSSEPKRKDLPREAQLDFAVTMEFLKPISSLA